MKKCKKKKRTPWYYPMVFDIHFRWLGLLGHLGHEAKKEAKEIKKEQDQYILFFAVIFFAYVLLTWLFDQFGIDIWIF